MPSFRQSVCVGCVKCIIAYPFTFTKATLYRVAFCMPGDAPCCIRAFPRW